MTLIIKNVDEAFLPIFQGIAKSIKAKCEVQASEKQALKWKKEANRMLKDYKAGKLKAFDDINELRAELEK
ncbi:hypothetical protein CQA38_06520 [Campylobacter sp. MIT 12-5580]|uniref:hypothetical protein n=1 Tax=Campylobacter sp. MIT 12-5580 TaxID=2040651 RepID=UPI0010F46C5C|nr:hypothetical protein [Campylobacter sp. MIT 12-5580]TKX28794.1 hypothetical protein CQA38_06520 [Campylobacter sp. MIT 12-5580]